MARLAALAPMEGVLLCSAQAKSEIIAGVIALCLGRKTIARDVTAMCQVQCSICGVLGFRV